MKKAFILVSIFTFIQTFAQDIWTNRHSFMQANNINTVFFADGVFNLDRYTFTNIEQGFIWPVSSPTRLTAVFSTGIWIAGKVGPQRELRMAVGSINSQYSPGNIPIIGQVPPVSVCNDTNWKVYLVNLNDQSLINGGVRTKIAGGRTYSFIYTSWTNWPISKGAPWAEINGIPGYQPGWNSDRPGIGNRSRARPEEICFMVFMDYTNCTNNFHVSELSHPGGTLPLGVEVHQISFAFNCPTLKDMYFVKWRLINKNQLNWDSMYFSLYNDPDIGDAFDDKLGCDSLRNLSFIYNGDNYDAQYGNNPPAVGLRSLQCPIVYTGNINDTAKLPYDTLIRYKMIRMSGCNFFAGSTNPCTSDPDHAIPGYNFMRGKDGCGNPLINYVTGRPTSFRYSGDACNQSGWFDSVSGDYRTIHNSGPFIINSRDTQIIVNSFIITRDGGNNFQNVCALQSLSDSALKYYYNDFQLCIPIGIQPISNEVPQKFMLYQNYPNPFNPATKIKFDIPPLPFGEGQGVGSEVRLIIFDILGREIDVLVNEQLQPGTYEVVWLASNYPSGVYFYQLTTQGFYQTYKMVLLK